jgi:DDE family transposase
MDKRAMELTLARMANEFLPYSIDQRLLLPPDMRDWLPEGHLALFVDDLVEQLDPESRIMPDGANKGSFMQGYKAQIAVDGEAQIIVAVDVVQAPNDKQQLSAMLRQVEQRVGSPAVTSADAGYYGEQLIEALERPSTELLVTPDRQLHGDPGLRGTLPACASTTDWMRYKLRTTIAAALYRMRKAIVEPVFGQIKSVRGLRRFLLRDLANVQDEFRLIALTHNLLQLHGNRAA